MDYGLELLLGYDGKRHYFATGHYLKFEVRQIETSTRTPHGLSYCLTLHAPEGRRLLGFDNAHLVSHRGGRFVKRPTASDHWHRDDGDMGRPYVFKNASMLLADFFDAVEQRLNELGIPNRIVKEASDGTVT